jgi:ABC-type branched-subunit amino acid transport system substrate-binding protein
MFQRRNLTLLTAVPLLIVLLITGCAPKLPPEPPWEKDARALLEQADGLFAKRQYDQATKAVDAFFTRYPKSRHADHALSLMGEIRLTQRDYPRALSYFKEIIEKHAASPFIIDARYKLGICYFELKEYDLAIANLDDRSRISDPVKLRRIAEMLSAAYLIKKNYLKALKEDLALIDLTSDERQKAGYRDRIREIINKNLSEEELRPLSSGTAYPADIALLRLAGLLIEQRKYPDAVKTSKEFIERFPAHPEKVRAEMLSAEATAKLTAPRYFIGTLIPQSGQLTFFGDRVLKGIQLAINLYNTKETANRVGLLVKDTEGSPEKALSALRELASQDIVAAVGPLLTKEVEALAPALEKLRVPVITPAASGPELGMLSPWIFRNALTNAGQAAAAAEYALKLKRRKFVILYPDDSYGRDLSRLFSKELTKKAEILANFSYPVETNDFGPYIKRIIEIDLRSRKIPIPEDEGERKKLFQEYTPSFDALYLPGYAERIGLLLPQLAFYSVTNVSVLGSNSWHSPDLIERAGRHAEGAVFVDGFFPESADPAIKSVVDAYRSAYQEEPDILSAQAYDAAMMVLTLLKAGKDSPAAVRDGLLSLQDFPGISGSTSFPGNGEARKKLFLLTVEDGKFVAVKD